MISTVKTAAGKVGLITTMKNFHDELELLKVPSFDKDPEPEPEGIIRRYIKTLKIARGLCYFSPGVIPKEISEEIEDGGLK